MTTASSVSSSFPSTVAAASSSSVPATTSIPSAQQAIKTAQPASPALKAPAPAAVEQNARGPKYDNFEDFARASMVVAAKPPVPAAAPQPADPIDPFANVFGGSLRTADCYRAAARPPTSQSSATSSSSKTTSSSSGSSVGPRW